MRSAMKHRGNVTSSAKPSLADQGGGGADSRQAQRKEEEVNQRNGVLAEVVEEAEPHGLTGGGLLPSMLQPCQPSTYRLHDSSSRPPSSDSSF